jgi:hypothetical protein
VDEVFDGGWGDEKDGWGDRESDSGLIFRRPFYVVDYEGFSRSFDRFQFQSKLRLQCSKYRRSAARVRDIGESRAIGIAGPGDKSSDGAIEREFEVNVEVASDSGFVHNGAIEKPLETVGEARGIEAGDIPDRARIA